MPTLGRTAVSFCWFNGVKGIVVYAYSTKIPVAMLGAEYKWARGAGLI